MSNDDGKRQQHTALIAGVFAVIAALIGGGFLLLNTILEHNLSLQTPTVIATNTPISSQFTPQPTSQIIVTPTPRPTQSANSEDFLNDLLVPCGGWIVGTVLWVIVASLIPWSFIWKSIVRPLLFFLLCALPVVAICAFIGSLFRATTVGVIIGSVLGTIFGGIVAYAIWKNRDRFSIIESIAEMFS